MAINVFEDDLVSLTELAKSLPKPPSHGCLWRWHRIGIQGVRLETVVVAGRRYSTRDAFQQFVNATTATLQLRTRPAERRDKSSGAA